MANYAGNIIGGMGSGAAVGGRVGGGWGALAGGVVGGLTGLFSSIAQDSDEERRREKLEELAANLNADYNDIIKSYQTWYANHSPAGTIDDGVKAANAIRSFDASKYDWTQMLDENGDGTVSRDEFNMDYDKEVSDFLNPYMDQIIDDVTKKTRGTAGGALTGRSTDAQRAMTSAAVQKEDELYKTALQAYQNDRDFQYKQWSDYNTAMQQRLKGLMDADQWQIGQMQQMGQDALNWQAQGFQAEQDAKQNQLQSKYALESAAWI